MDAPVDRTRAAVHASTNVRVRSIAPVWIADRPPRSGLEDAASVCTAVIAADRGELLLPWDFSGRDGSACHHSVPLERRGVEP
ncbi:MAG TPA: hypothetical protein VHC70_00635 [Phycisphaerales bacterium]|nr:hypothetical protein [Phycisphaerales bacterium]